MLNKIFQILFLLIGTILIGSGITALFVHDKLTDKQIYINAFREEDIYDDYAKEFYEAALAETIDQKENPVAYEVGLLTYDEGKFKPIFETIVNESIAYTLDWVKSKEEDLYVYVPKGELIDYINKEEVLGKGEDIFGKYYSEYNSLPLCRSNQNEGVFFDGEDLPELNCRDLEIRTESQLKTEFLKAFTTKYQDLSEEQILAEVGLAGYQGKTKVSDILNDDDYDQLDQDLDFLQTFYKFVWVMIIALIVVGGVFCLISLFLIRFTIKNFLIALVSIPLGIGLFTFISSIVGVILWRVFVTADNLFSSLDLNERGIDNLNGVSDYLSFRIFLTSLVVGGVLFVICLILRVVIGLIPTRRKKGDESFQEG